MRMNGDWKLVSSRNFVLENVLQVHIRSGGTGTLVSTAAGSELRIAIASDSAEKTSDGIILDYLFSKP